MFSFQPSNPADKPLRYRELCEAADAITAGEPDGVANMANVAALIWHFVRSEEHTSELQSHS